MNLIEEFEQKRLIYNLARYETNYKITLGYLCNELSIQVKDQELEIQYMLGSIYELIKELSNEKNLELQFDEELRKQAAIDALQFFVNENIQEVKNGKLELESYINKINDNQLFNETMNKLLRDNEQILLQKWENIITQELANAILTSLKDLENN